MNSGITFGGGMGKTTISDITTTKNTEEAYASDDNYYIESDFTEVSLTNTMVNADDDEITADSQDTNYYTPIQDEEFFDNNDETLGMDENISLHKETRGSNEDTQPDEAQLPNDNDN